MLGKEGNFVMIRHGASYHRCHPCRLIKKTPDVDTSVVPERGTERDNNYSEEHEDSKTSIDHNDSESSVEHNDNKSGHEDNDS